jgi:hypothetical protein
MNYVNGRVESREPYLRYRRQTRATSSAQNIKQLESSFQTNKREEDDDDFDYLYGIVTTVRD